MNDVGYRSRALAGWLLHRVLDRGQKLNSTLLEAQELGGRMSRMAPRDRAFVRLLVVTVLRRLGQIDDALIRCLDRPLNRLARPAKNILRLAAAQTMFLNTPGHAVADGAVRSLRPREEHLKGLVNAVSRRLIRDCQDILAEQDEVDLNCPKWLRNSWSASCGDQTAMKIIAATLMEPPLDITVKGDQQAWAENLDAKILPTGSLRCYTGGAVQELPGYDEGEWWVQDMAAALPVRLFGDVAGRAVLDLCAAPGGKTAQLAASGARVTAVDEAPNRLSLLRSNLERLGLKAELSTADVRTWRPSAPFDKILLDAPCSATGTIRRHPDIWHLCTKNDVERAAVLQDQLLRAAVEMLAPGGTLVYSTCSLQSEEGETRIAKLLASDDRIKRDQIEAHELYGLSELISTDGDLRTLPHYLDGMDGFFAARLVRN